MRGKSRGFFGLSRGSLPPLFPVRQPTPFRSKALPPVRPPTPFRSKALIPVQPPQLSASEQGLIANYLKLYQALDNGKRIPTTKEQAHFVGVCCGKAIPKTVHERAYLKWKALQSKRPEVNLSNNSVNRFPPRTKDTAQATTKQVNYLIALGASPQEAKAMTIKQASAKISDLIAKRKAQVH